MKTNSQVCKATAAYLDEAAAELRAAPLRGTINWAKLLEIIAAILPMIIPLFMEDEPTPPAT